MRKTLLLCLLLSGVIAFSFLGFSGDAYADTPKGGWDKTITGLREAIKVQNESATRSLISKLMKTGEEKGVRSVIRYAMGIDDHTVYSYAAGHLAKLTDKDLRGVVFEELGKNRNPKTQIVLLAVVRRWTDDPAAMKALHGRLGDRRNPVVFTALRWIRQINDPKLSMSPLIAELAKRERGARGRVYFDIRSTLTKLSGEDFDVSADWKNFWAIRKDGKVAPKKPKKKEGGRTKLYKRPSFFSMTLDSDRIVFLIDISGSMEVEDPVIEEGPEEPEDIGNGTTVVRRPRKKTPGGQPPKKRSRISAVKEELAQTIQALPSSVKFNIFSFNHEVELFDSSAGLLPADSGNKRNALAWIKALAASGATRTDSALVEALKMIEADTIILLTDGAPKKINNEKIAPQVVFSTVNAYNRFRKVRINTIGFMQAGVSMRNFVQELAQMNDGKCILLK